MSAGMRGAAKAAAQKLKPLKDRLRREPSIRIAAPPGGKAKLGAAANRIADEYRQARVVLHAMPKKVKILVGEHEGEILPVAGLRTDTKYGLVVDVKDGPCCILLMPLHHIEFVEPRRKK